jgi:exodeoxyribonuclease III
MKIITWNVNGYRSVVGQNPSKRYNVTTKENKLFSYIEQENPDIICLQETKADPEQIDEAVIAPPGYLHYYNACKESKGYSGVVVFTKNKPKSVKMGIGVEKFDNEGRIIECDFGDFVLFNIYFPKGYANSERLTYKLEFYDNMFDYIQKLRKKHPNIIISGDYNTAHQPIDLAHPGENVNTSGFMPIEREKLDKIIEQGYVDTFRHLNKEPNNYTWWSQRSQARLKNIGWRIDYHFVTKPLTSAIKKVIQQPDVIGSDHCPVVLDLDIGK